MDIYTSIVSTFNYYEEVKNIHVQIFVRIYAFISLVYT